MFASWTIARKATVVAALCSTVAVVAQKFLLGRALTPLGVWLVLAVPFACCVGAAWLFTWYVTRKRYGELIQTYAQLASGDFSADMPGHAPDAEAAVVRSAFLSMTRALEEARARLAHCGQEAGQESGSVAGAGRAGRAP